jgi:hypothetical protein
MKWSEESLDTSPQYRSIKLESQNQ